MALITDDLGNVEDATFLQKAIKSVITSKDLQRQKDWGDEVQYASKAVQIAEKLFLLRKDQQPDYRILQAAFYYYLGATILGYAENTISIFGEIAPLPDDELPTDSEEEEEEGSEEENANEE